MRNVLKFFSELRFRLPVHNEIASSVVQKSVTERNASYRVHAKKKKQENYFNDFHVWYSPFLSFCKVGGTREYPAISSRRVSASFGEFSRTTNYARIPHLRNSHRTRRMLVHNAAKSRETFSKDGSECLQNTAGSRYRAYASFWG